MLALSYITTKFADISQLLADLSQLAEMSQSDFYRRQGNTNGSLREGKLAWIIHSRKAPTCRQAGKKRKGLKR